MNRDSNLRQIARGNFAVGPTKHGSVLVSRKPRFDRRWCTSTAPGNKLICPRSRRCSLSSSSRRSVRVFGSSDVR